MQEFPELFEQAKSVLKHNDQGKWTIPASGLYPHQWLWDSCFIAIGLRHYNVGRAQKELRSLLRGQWSNGMMPNIILTQGVMNRHSPEFWRSNTSPFSPDNVPTSGITQPPMLAQAVYSVGEKLNLPERRSWYKKMFPSLLAYHQWLYEDRDPRQEGLVVQIHPWETGLDNTPPWMHAIHQSAVPFWIKTVDKLGLDTLITLLRKDRKYALPGERLSTIDGLLLYELQRKLRSQRYDTKRILKRSKLAIQDVTFNAILIRANTILLEIAKTINTAIPEDLEHRFTLNHQAFEQLWDGYSRQYYSRSYVTKKLIRVASIGSLMALYAGSISPERADLLVQSLHDNKMFGAEYPVPSVPLNSSYFKHHAYWQGPTWINTNWLLVDGLLRYGYTKEAQELRTKSLALVASHGSYEYFSPLDGTPAGADHFSWTAALTIDLLHQKRR
jgi:hypothetical protein